MTEYDYKRLIREFEDELYGYVFNLLRDRTVSYDIVEECFMITWKKYEEISVEQSKAFLFNTAHNLVKKEFHIQKKRKMMANGIFEVSDTYADMTWEDQNYIEAITSLLPAEWKQCLMLHTWEGYSYEEIARMLNISKAVVKSNIFRARKRLRELRYKEI
ncbi:MAG: RNA polymerase sigma factor [Bacteroidales bacterium]|nr:RNA polymerase sigma factor [Bacteroidales bacterium]